MSVIDQLATSLGRRDEIPNQALAAQITRRGDKKAIRELVDNLRHRDTRIQSDCIKVLYEIGALEPTLIAAYHETFVTLLGSKNNRIVWGAMTALDALTLEKPKAVFEALPGILEAANEGSVITRDHFVGILIKLASLRQYADRAFRLLLAQLRSCPTNQLPMYAENALHVVSGGNRGIFVKTLASRLDGMERATGQRRIQKVIRTLDK